MIWNPPDFPNFGDSDLRWLLWHSNSNFYMSCPCTSSECHKCAIRHVCSYLSVSWTGVKAYASSAELHPDPALASTDMFVPGNVEMQGGGQGGGTLWPGWDGGGLGPWRGWDQWQQHTAHPSPLPYPDSPTGGSPDLCQLCVWQAPRNPIRLAGALLRVRVKISSYLEPSPKLHWMQQRPSSLAYI